MSKQMNRSGRRRVLRSITALLRRDADHCSICRAELRHNTQTFGGITGAGVIAMVGECCRSHLTRTLIFGVYTTRPYDGLSAGNGRIYTSDQAAKGVVGFQRYVDAVDELGRSTAKRAGLSRPDVTVRLKDTPWKADDARWFKENPTRSHRLRPSFPGEGLHDPDVPAGFELYTIVRQVEPGMRVRVRFAHNIEGPVPDEEEIIHALFDVWCASETGDELGTVGELAAMYRHHIREQ